MKFELITILGPTATGKTKLAAHLANQLNGEKLSLRIHGRFINLWTLVQVKI